MLLIFDENKKEKEPGEGGGHELRGPEPLRWPRATEHNCSPALPTASPCALPALGS